MSLIDVNELYRATVESANDNPHTDIAFKSAHTSEHIHFLNLIDKQEIVDPVIYAGGCYCKNCIYHEAEEILDNTGELEWYVKTDSYYCDLHSVTTPLNGFCSEGKVKNEY